MKARQKRVPSGIKMPVSPMIEAGVDKGLSRTESEAQGEEMDTSVVNCTGGPTENEADEEGRKAVIRRGVEGPTKKEREEHEATHCPYRSWCRHCVRGRGRNSPHFKKKGEEEEQEGKVARVSMDYFFMSVDEEKASSNPIIVMIDESSGSVYARGTGKKGTAEMDWLIKDMSEN